MLLSRTHGFLFIHVPKTGGTALAMALARYCGIKARIAYEGGNIKGVRRLIVAATGGEVVRRLTGFNAHTSYAEARKILGARDIENLFSFAVVRNPYERALSMYAHIRRVPHHPAHRLARSVGFAEAMPQLLEDGWFNQAYKIVDPETGGVAINQVLAYETLAEDLQVLQASLRLPQPLKLKTVNASNRTQPDTVAEFADQAEVFATFMKKDFQLLGYSSDPRQSLLPPRRSVSPASTE